MMRRKSRWEGEKIENKPKKKKEGEESLIWSVIFIIALMACWRKEQWVSIIL